MKKRKRLLAVGFLSGLAILGAVVQAQAPATPTPGKIYTKKSEFKLPVKFDATQRARLSEVQLYVKQGPSDTWRMNQKAPATSSEFKFKAPCDGEYWFNVVTVDLAGKMNPADVGKEAPGLMVVVDTQAPEVDVKPAMSPSGELLFQCDVKDANTDNSKTKLEFLTADRQWQPLEAHPSQAGYYRIPDPVLLKGMVRATAYDRSGNYTTREFNLAAMTTVASSTPMPAPHVESRSDKMPAAATPAPMPMVAQPTPMPAVAQPTPMSTALAPVTPVSTTPVTAPVPMATPAIAPAPMPVPVPANQVQLAPATMAPQAPVTTPAPMPAPAPTAPSVPAPMSSVPAPAVTPATPTTIQTVACTNPASGAPCRAASTPPLQMVNGKHVALDYQVDQMGPSGVSKVEVWMTRDEGQSWQKLCEDADRRSPVEFDLPGEGTFGVSLVVCSGSGTEGTPPSRGDTPDWWVEVDSTRPIAQLLAVRPCSKEEMGTYLITWTAADKNLKAEPVDLYYAMHKDGPWQPIAKGVKNDGNYRWPLPPGLQGEIFVRLEVTDRAGNSTHCEASQGAFMDLAHPKARVIGIATAGQHN